VAACSSASGVDGASKGDASFADSAPSDAASVDAVSADASSDAIRLDAGVPDGAIGAASGSRLKAQLIVTDDGAGAFVGWFDSARRAPCSFQTADDGMERCLPSDAPSIIPAFLDPQCTMPALRAAPDACHPLPAMVLVEASSGCRGGKGVYTVGSSIAGATSYFSMQLGACTAGQNGSAELHPLTPLPASDFVGATEMPAGTGRLVVRELVSEDGARSRIGWIDTTGNTPCHRALASDREQRCLPEPGAYHLPGTFFSDAACTAEAAISYQNQCSSSSPIIQEPRPDLPPINPARFTDCSFAVALRNRGAAISAPDSHERSGGMCITASVALARVSARLYALGPVIDPAGFARLTAAEISGPRLHALEEIAEDGAAKLLDGTFVDSASGAGCAFEVAADGVLRCLPYGALDVRYTDSECTNRVAVFHPDPEPGCSVSIQYARIAEQNGCKTMTRVFSVGATVSTPNLYLAVGSGCVSIGIPVGDLVYPLQAEVPARSFQQGMLVTE
jgi:hypothetical protein